MDRLISEQAVIDSIEFFQMNPQHFSFVNLIDDIKEIPSVEPQTGHWILTSDDDYEYCTCSECGYQNGENWMIGSQIKFCQECGARMIEPQESEE